MNYFDATILGIVEGITEFLPISSTGHMILTSALLHIPDSDFLKSFEIIIQLGAILAAVILYAKTLVKNIELSKKVLVAFLPTAVIGLTVYKIVKSLLGSNAVVVAALFLGGIVILLFARWEKKQTEKIRVENFSDISYKKSFFVGLYQSIALIPGVSRSAATIIGGRLMGISRKEIVEFSFMLAIPTMIAASGLDILKNYKTILAGNFGILIWGFLVSFVVAYFAIRTFLGYIQKHSFAVFGWYRIIISIVAFFFLL